MRIIYRTLIALMVFGAGAAAWLLPASRQDDKLAAAAPSPDLQRRQEIAFYERRLREDPRSALDMAQLAALLVEEGRMTGDERVFVEAEALSRKSLGERTR